MLDNYEDSVYETAESPLDEAGRHGVASGEETITESASRRTFRLNRTAEVLNSKSRV